MSPPSISLPTAARPSLAVSVFLAARPKTLAAGVVPVWLGCVLAWWEKGVIHWDLAGWTLGVALLIQIATNFFNDAIDHEKGADTPERHGPRRVTATGMMRQRTVLALALVFLALTALCGLPLIQARGWALLWIGVPSLYLAYGYTGGPVPLAYRGLGEAFVILFFGVVAVMGTVFVQTGEWLASAALLGLQVGLFSAVLIAVNNLRDIEGDRRCGKRTLAVRFGEERARKMITAFCLMPHALALGWLVLEGLDGLGLAAAAFPTIFVGAGVLRVWGEEPGPIYNRFLALGALQLLVFAAIFTGAAFLAA